MAIKKSNRKLVLVGLAVALTFVVLGVFFFSYSNETFDQQAAQLGATEQTVYNPPFANYTIPGLDKVWGAIIVGAAGTLMLFAVSILVGKAVSKRRSE
jgi:hypothetical protein